jgi:gamma-glutamyltranspeptidase/glutathione hydrolase
MVVSSSPIAADVGVGILQNGGNAVDAAVAAAFALSVAEPSMSGLGGRTQILIRLPSGAFEGIDGATQVPAGAASVLPRDEVHDGYASIGVPGTVAALARAHASYGRLAWSEVLFPAITLAREGFPLPTDEAGRIAAVAREIRAYPGSRTCFLDEDGAPLVPGRTLLQRDLARVLESLAQSGPDVFYRGWIAERIAIDMARNGGHVTRADLARYQARPAEVVQGVYREHELTGTYLPASGATTIEALKILEHFEAQPETAVWVALVAQCLRLSFEDRNADLDTPGSQADELTSAEWTRRRAGDVRHPASSAAPTGPRLVPRSQRSSESPHTTHLSVADEQQMLVALTQSLGPSMGSKVTTPGLGFIHAATMGYLDLLAPGDRAWSSQSPLMVARDGRPAYVLGAAGARRIISSLVEVVSRMVDRRQSLAEAIAQPRFHATPERLYMETREDAAWRLDDLAALHGLGFDAVPRSRGSYFARVHGIEIEAATGEYVGVADPRGDGAARGVIQGIDKPRAASERGLRGHVWTSLSTYEDHAGGDREAEVVPRARLRRGVGSLKGSDRHDRAVK